MYDSTYMGVPRVIKFIEAESRMVVTEHWGELLFIGYRVSVWDDVKVLEMDNNTADILNATELYAYKWLKWCIFCYICFTTM